MVAAPAGTLRAGLERALGSGLPAVNRLSYARATVRFHVADTGETLTALLDRKPPRVATGDESAEISIDLSADQAELFAAGLLPLSAAVAAGTVATAGPVREYLEVDPILRQLLAHQSNGSAPIRPGDRQAFAVAGAIDRDLLAVETRDLHRSFGADAVLEGVDLAVPEGVISVVLGPSGTGKSVLLQHIIGLMKPDSGDVIIRGRPLSGMSRSELLALRREIGVMFQDGALFSAMDVFDNVAFPMRQHTDLVESEIREIVMGHLESVGLGDAAHLYPSSLSGGMKKRAGLARSLVLEPGIVLCDEPDSGLDPVRTALLGDLLVEQHGQYGGTMIVVTHNVALAKQISEHISVLWRGKVLESGLTESLFESKTEFVQQFLRGEARGPLGMDA
jgi:phospholipid/cholesterol/gamma-HCH transport system ATP-binding protein